MPEQMTWGEWLCMYAPAIAVVALKLILARYESNHSDVGLSLTALAG